MSSAHAILSSTPDAVVVVYAMSSQLNTGRSGYNQAPLLMAIGYEYIVGASFFYEIGRTVLATQDSVA